MSTLSCLRFSNSCFPSLEYSSSRTPHCPLLCLKQVGCLLKCHLQRSLPWPFNRKYFTPVTFSPQPTSLITVLFSKYLVPLEIIFYNFWYINYCPSLHPGMQDVYLVPSLCSYCFEQFLAYSGCSINIDDWLIDWMNEHLFSDWMKIQKRTWPVKMESVIEEEKL